MHKIKQVVKLLQHKAHTVTQSVDSVELCTFVKPKAFALTISKRNKRPKRF